VKGREDSNSLHKYGGKSGERYPGAHCHHETRGKRKSLPKGKTRKNVIRGQINLVGENLPARVKGGGGRMGKSRGGKRRVNFKKKKNLKKKGGRNLG